MPCVQAMGVSKPCPQCGVSAVCIAPSPARDASDPTHSVRARISRCRAVKHSVLPTAGKINYAHTCICIIRQHKVRPNPRNISMYWTAIILHAWHGTPCVHMSVRSARGYACIMLCHATANTRTPARACAHALYLKCACARRGGVVV